MNNAKITLINIMNVGHKLEFNFGSPDALLPLHGLFYGKCCLYYTTYYYILMGGVVCFENFR